MKKDKKIIGVGLLTAIASSLCCITPVLALISGTSGVASTFSWMEPFRPYLIGFTILVLGFAWYQKLMPRTKEEIACGCDQDEKVPFMQSKMFLGIVTAFAILMLAFPNYAAIFYPSNDKKEVIIVHASNIQTVQFNIEGMTCNGCASHVENEVNKVSGIVSVNASYEQSNAKVEFDNSKTTVEEIEKAINSTGYSVINNTKEK